MQFAGLDQYAVTVTYTNPRGRGPNAGARVTRTERNIMAYHPEGAADAAIVYYEAAGKLDVTVTSITRI
ncbi:MAG TPA: hypothetical protein VFC00_12320 [Micromonosporaceae bacterium]|nr:hypothetical protein [Micromonosporaceae bacterium]